MVASGWRSVAGQRPLDHLSPRARPPVGPGRRPGPGIVAPPTAGEHVEQIVFPYDVPRRRPPVVCRCWSVWRVEVCALIPGPAPRKHAPPRTVFPPCASWGPGGIVAPIAESRLGFSEQYPLLLNPRPTRSRAAGAAGPTRALNPLEE